LANATVHIYTLTASGLIEENPKLFTVFPNPSSGYFNIELSEVGTLQVIDMTGKVIFFQVVDASQDFIKIDLSQNTKGLYLIKFTNRLNLESLVKIIVE
jgi:hypothetical protein